MAEIGSLTFEKPDFSAFKCLAHAFFAAETGGTLPAVMNGANETAVGLFLNNKIGFNDIQYSVEHMVSNECPFLKVPSLDDVLTADKWARTFILNETIGGLK